MFDSQSFGTFRAAAKLWQPREVQGQPREWGGAYCGVLTEPLKEVVPKLFRLVASLTYWGIGCSAPLQLQAYTLYKAAGFLRRFCGSPGWFP